MQLMMLVMMTIRDAGSQPPSPSIDPAINAVSFHQQKQQQGWQLGAQLQT
jgi:hypothetical protein